MVTRISTHTLITYGYTLHGYNTYLKHTMVFKKKLYLIFQFYSLLEERIFRKLEYSTTWRNNNDLAL